jgi:hypothetical protein
MRLTLGMLLFTFVMNLAEAPPAAAANPRKPKLTAAEPSISTLINLKDALDFCALSEGNMWELVVKFKTERGHSNADAANLFKTFSESPNSVSMIWVEPHRTAARMFSRKYSSEAQRFFASLNMLGKNVPTFTYSTGLPIQYVNDDGKLLILVINIAIDTVFNTLRLTPKERAAKVIEANVLPVLSDLREAFAVAKPNEVGIVVTYGSRDFSVDSELEAEPESVCLIAKVADVGAFANAKISDVELVSRSSVLLRDRDIRLQFKKVSLKLE